MARRASADRGLLGGAPDPGLRTGRFELIGNPPLSERTGRRRWSAEVAKKLVGWKTEEVLVLAAWPWPSWSPPRPHTTVSPPATSCSACD
ncbi:DUF6192 family protein [Streptomyces pristinaespiralis]|uniref:DUF6192 family protein n=1 Tax=Streptomyces pristinaespiralis TaxID=38300 RepID=UPI00379C1560